MKLETILSEWEKDAEISRTDLFNESLKIPKLQHKYYELYVKEKLTQVKLEQDYKDMYLIKYQYYLQGLSKEELAEHGWEQFTLKILKTDIGKYTDADPDLKDISLKIAMAKEKVATLDFIVDEIAKRSYSITNAIAWAKFQNGVG